MTTHVSFHNAKPFLQSWLPPDVMQTIEKSCDTTKGCTIIRQSSYKGQNDPVKVRCETLKGNQFEIEFEYNIKLKTNRYNNTPKPINEHE